METIDQQVAAEQRLAARLGEYAGKWIAVRDHDVVRSANTLDDLFDGLGETEVEGVFRVPEGKGTVCFF